VPQPPLLRSAGRRARGKPQLRGRQSGPGRPTRFLGRPHAEPSAPRVLRPDAFRYQLVASILTARFSLSVRTAEEALAPGWTPLMA
jgi:hypothetical protein